MDLDSPVHQILILILLLLQGDAWSFNMIQNYASNLFRGKILVGHSLWNDLAGQQFP